MNTTAEINLELEVFRFETTMMMHNAADAGSIAQAEALSAMNKIIVRVETAGLLTEFLAIVNEAK